MRRFVNWLIPATVLLALLAGRISPATAAKGFVPAPGSPFPPGVSQLFTVKLADLNADGNLDAVVPDGYGVNVAVLLGDGEGRLSAAAGSPFEVPDGAGPVAIGDFNGDGKLDVAVGNQSHSGVSVLLGDGEGGLSPAPAGPFAISGPASDLAAEDFNRDGRLDVAVLFPHVASVLLGDGQGGFSLAPGSPFSTGGDPFVMAVADLNRDANVDLAVVNRSPVDVSVQLGEGNGTFSAAAGSPYSTGGVVLAVAAGDFNRDRILDLAATNNNSSPDSPFGSVAVLRGDGAGGFSAVRGSPFFTREDAVLSLAVGDFNRDRKLDAAVAGEGADDVPVFLGNGNGALRPARYGPVSTGGREPDCVAAGDLNEDGRSDLVVTNFVSNDVSVLLSRRGR